MGYGREVYDSVAAQLSARRAAAKQTEREHRAEVAQKCPRALEIEHEIAQVGLQAARIITAGGADVRQQIESLGRRNLAQQQALADALRGAGFPADYMDPPYRCAQCGDEGYIDGQMCSCMKQLLRMESYRRLNELSPMALCDFSNFDLNYYPIEPDAKTHLSPREVMRDVLKFCRDYADQFSLQSGNIFMSGATGLGKTHLSLAIARAAIDRGFGVIYGSAQNFMLQVEKEHFGRAAVDTDIERNLLECDLLILDDLGTEFITQYVTSTIYNLINTRLMRSRPTIISSNLSFTELEQRYTQRVLSRIMGGYRTLRFLGRDVRQIRAYAGR